MPLSPNHSCGQNECIRIAIQRVITITRPAVRRKRMTAGVLLPRKSCRFAAAKNFEVDSPRSAQLKSQLV